MKRAVFPGSFDPFTIGHLDVLKSSLRLFDSVVIAVGYNLQKGGYFSVEERIEIIRQSVAHLKHVEIESYSGMTIDFCNKTGAEFIIRGVRSTTDFDFERVIAQANTKMSPNIQTVFIPSSPEYSFISSTVVRDVLVNGGDAGIVLTTGLDISALLKKRG